MSCKQRGQIKEMKLKQWLNTRKCEGWNDTSLWWFNGLDRPIVTAAMVLRWVSTIYQALLWVYYMDYYSFNLHSNNLVKQELLLPHFTRVSPGNDSHYGIQTSDTQNPYVQPPGALQLQGKRCEFHRSSMTLGKSPYLPGSLWPYRHGAKVPWLLLKTPSIIWVLFSPDKTMSPNIWGQLNTTLPFLSKHPTHMQTYTRMYKVMAPISCGLTGPHAGKPDERNWDPKRRRFQYSQDDHFIIRI